MVREHQIVAAPVDVERRAKQYVTHGRAFDMPARTTATPRAVPPGQIIAGRFPQHKIHRVALVGSHFYAGAGDHVIDRTARQFAIALFPAVHCKQNVPFGGISVAAGNQPFDHSDHLANILGCARGLRRLQRTQGTHVIKEPLNGFVGDLADIATGFSGAGVDLVIDVGEVPHIGDVIGAINMAQQAEQQVKDHHGPRIP